MNGKPPTEEERALLLRQDALPLQTIINLARGAPLDDWPPTGIWLERYKDLAAAVESGELPVKWSDA